MKTVQIKMKMKDDPNAALKTLVDMQPHLTLVFGDVHFFQAGGVAASLKAKLGGTVVGCSTAGEIGDRGVESKTMIATAIRFDDPSIRTTLMKLDGSGDSQACGRRLGDSLKKADLKAVFIIGQGLNINGSALIKGVKESVGENIVITGGLAGDDGAFQKTFVVHDDSVNSDSVAAVGFYGEKFEFGFGSRGGWESFGPVRKVTKAEGTKLLEIDGEKALNVYKAYLKDFAKDLPASGLLFPFALLDNNESDSGIIRTILGIDENEGSLTLAGDIHPGQLVRLMHTKTEGLVSGARAAAELAAKDKGDDGLGILVSCVGRKLVMGDDVEEEVEAVQEALPASHITGFYSYGEIAPFKSLNDCQLHNQTMTITYINEKKAA